MVLWQENVKFHWIMLTSFIASGPLSVWLATDYQNVEVESVGEKFLLVGLGLRDGLFWKLSKFFFPDV